jgi:hypothetical protein
LSIVACNALSLAALLPVLSCTTSLAINVIFKVVISPTNRIVNKAKVMKKTGTAPTFLLQN